MLYGITPAFSSRRTSVVGETAEDCGVGKSPTAWNELETGVSPYPGDASAGFSSSSSSPPDWTFHKRIPVKPIGAIARMQYTLTWTVNHLM